MFIARSCITAWFHKLKTKIKAVVRVLIVVETVVSFDIARCALVRSTVHSRTVIIATAITVVGNVTGEVVAHGEALTNEDVFQGRQPACLVSMDEPFHIPFPCIFRKVSTVVIGGDVDKTFRNPLVEADEGIVVVVVFIVVVCYNRHDMTPGKSCKMGAFRVFVTNGGGAIAVITIVLQGDAITEPFIQISVFHTMATHFTRSLFCVMVHRYKVRLTTRLIIVSRMVLIMADSSRSCYFETVLSIADLSFVVYFSHGNFPKAPRNSRKQVIKSISKKK